MIEPMCENPTFQQAAADLECALHDLAQPLTALSFLSQVARMQNDPTEWKAALGFAEVETKRAMNRLRDARDAAMRLTGAEGVVRRAQ